MQVKDILVTINGKSILGLTVRDVVPLIAGPERTKLDLTLVRGEARAQVLWAEAAGMSCVCVCV